VGLVVVLAFAWALFPQAASGQEARDPLIDPPEGGAGSRFQIVGQFGWTPGETVTLRIGTTSADPASFAGPFPFEQNLTVLRDGTWSFPISVNDTLLSMPLGATPGYIVVQATSPTKTATNFYVFTVNGARPTGADVIAPLGFGPTDASPVFAITVALFAAATGALIAFSGASRWRMAAPGSAAQLLQRQPKFPQERVTVRLATEKRSNQFVAVDRATSLEDRATIREPGCGVENASLLEPREHVITEDARPEISVVTSVVAEQVPEPGLKVRVLGIRKTGDGVQLSERRGGVAIEPGRVESEVHTREKELAQRRQPGADVLGPYHRIEQFVGSGAPVRWCLEKRRSTSRSHTQCSSICEGASTKSRSVDEPLNSR